MLGVRGMLNRVSGILACFLQVGFPVLRSSGNAAKNVIFTTFALVFTFLDKDLLYIYILIKFANFY